jgi:hypothetical protein
MPIIGAKFIQNIPLGGGLEQEGVPDHLTLHPSFQYLILSLLSETYHIKYNAKILMVNYYVHPLSTGMAFIHNSILYT